jgi:hypothetical protein
MYHHFLRRVLDLLAPDGLGVYLVPGVFLTSRAAQPAVFAVGPPLGEQVRLGLGERGGGQVL